MKTPTSPKSDTILPGKSMPCHCGHACVPVMPGLRYALVSHVTPRGEPCCPNGWGENATATGIARAYANWDDNTRWDLGPDTEFCTWP